MSIVTKTGDTGSTSLFGGVRVRKSDLSVEAYGTVDELSSFLGLLHAKLSLQKEKDSLTGIQKDLHQIMASLANFPKTNFKLLDKQVKIFEGEIEKLEKKLPRLTSFILPQGGEIAALFHIARTVCRRAERSVVRYFHEKLQVTSPPAGRAGHKSQVISYLNRLSDLLFMMARKYSQKEERININKS